MLMFNWEKKAGTRSEDEPRFGSQRLEDELEMWEYLIAQNE